MLSIWETPFTQIASKTKLRQEWHNINKQHNINIRFKVFSKEDNNHSVYWDLKYEDKNNQPVHYKGTYFFRLNSNNKCDYFFQCSETKTEK